LAKLKLAAPYLLQKKKPEASQQLPPHFSLSRHQTNPSLLPSTASLPFSYKTAITFPQIFPQQLFSPPATAAPSSPVSQQPTHGSAGATLFTFSLRQRPQTKQPPAAARTQQHLEISSHPSSFCQLPEAEGKTKNP
jgi:hypothetical protein